MLGRVVLALALAAGGVPPTLAWAQGACAYALQTDNTRVVYLGRTARAGGFLRCRLTPRYRWFCDGWAGPEYVFYGNVPTCY
jgi:hypothetical protein